MKKVLIIIVAIIIILVLFIIIKTFTYPFAKADKTVTASDINITLSESAIRNLAGGIQFPTIINEVYEDTNFEPFIQFREYLKETYPRIYETMDTLSINKYAMVFHWKGRNSTANPILFLSHYDVVPVVGYDPDEHEREEIIYRPDEIIENKNDESLEATWDFPPFSGAVVNNSIYGRGTLDMKCMLFGIMEAANDLIAEGFQPEQDIWFAFGQDEERNGQHGAVQIAQYFKSLGLTFDAVYDEGGIIAAPESAIDAVKVPMALVGLGEKGFLTLKIRVYGIGGHSSMPPKKSSLVYASEIVEKLNENQFQAELIPPIASFLDNIGGEMGFTSRMAIANQWLLKPLLLSNFSKAPASNALIRTTIAVTMMKGSDAPNVLSSSSEITVNFRILQGTTVNDVVEHVKNICKDYDVDIEIAASREPSGITPNDTQQFNRIREVITSIYPNAIVSSYITIGGTDAYKYQLVSDNIYRFMPVELNQYEQRTIHNENEHISLNNYGKMIYYFKEIMKKYK